jgi:hypothetical protein
VLIDEAEQERLVKRKREQVDGNSVLKSGRK